MAAGRLLVSVAGFVGSASPARGSLSCASTGGAVRRPREEALRIAARTAKSFLAEVEPSSFERPEQPDSPDAPNGPDRA